MKALRWIAFVVVATLLPLVLPAEALGHSSFDAMYRRLWVGTMRCTDGYDQMDHNWSYVSTEVRGHSGRQCNAFSYQNPGWIAVKAEWYHTTQFGYAPGTFCAYTNWVYNPNSNWTVSWGWNGNASDLCGWPFQYSIDSGHYVWNGYNWAGGWVRPAVWHNYS